MGTCTDAKASIGQVDVVESQRERREACQANVEGGGRYLGFQKIANGNGPAVRHEGPWYAAKLSRNFLPVNWDIDQGQYRASAQQVEGRMQECTARCDRGGDPGQKNSGENWRLSGVSGDHVAAWRIWHPIGGSQGPCTIIAVNRGLVIADSQ